MLRHTVVATLVLVGCSSPLPPPEGPVHGFVAQSVTLPIDPEKRPQLSIDIDGDGRKDNGFASLLGAVRGSGSTNDPQGRVTEEINRGTTLWLFELQALDLQNARYPALTVHYGVPMRGTTAADWFGGSGSFRYVDEAALQPAAGLTLIGRGQLRNGGATFGPFTAPYALPFGPGNSLEFTLQGAYVKLTVNADGSVDGVLDGAFSVQERDQKVFPRIVALLNDRIMRHDVGADAILMFFDTDGDGMISMQEFTGNDVVQGAFKPDVRLFDSHGRYSPRSRDAADAISLGVGFHLVPATIDAAPTERLDAAVTDDGGSDADGGAGH